MLKLKLVRGMRFAAVAMIWSAGVWFAQPATAQTTSTAPTPVAPSRTPTGRLTGDVTDMRGTPLAGSSVAVTDTSGKPLMTVTTNANGIFTVDGLGEGEYFLNVDAKGFYKKKEKAKVKVNKTGKIHIKLKFIPVY